MLATRDGEIPGIPGNGAGEAHLDHTWLWVLQVQQERDEPIEDLLRENLRVGAAEAGQVSEEDDGGATEVWVFLGKRGKTGITGRKCQNPHPGIPKSPSFYPINFPSCDPEIFL